jgi:hypothetical protein
MKNSTLSSAGLKLISIGAGLAILLCGCATKEGYSFNREFSENVPTDPRYYIKGEGPEHFTIVVHQGSPSTEAGRATDLKQAATAVAEAETQRLGWLKWHLDYIQERDQGWMHIVVAKVTREDDAPAVYSPVP